MKGYYTFKKDRGYKPVYMTSHGGLERKQDLIIFNNESEGREHYNQTGFIDFRYYLLRNYL